MIRIGAGALAAKLVVGSLGGSKVLGAIGPLKTEGLKEKQWHSTEQEKDR